MEALSKRVEDGHTAVEDARRAAAQRRLLHEYAHALLLREADLVSTAAAGGPPSPGDEGVAGRRAAALLRQWCSEEDLKPVLPECDGRDVASNAARRNGGVAGVDGEGEGEAGGSAAGDHGVQVGMPRVRTLEHTFRNGFWLLSATVVNDGLAVCHQLCAAVCHDEVPLLAEGSNLQALHPGASGVLTLAAPLSSLFHAGLLVLDVVLCWREVANGGASVAGDPSTAATFRGASLPPLGATDSWRRRVAARAQLDSDALFQAALPPELSSVRQRSSLPPALTRSVCLLLQSPPGASHLLQQLPHLLASTLRLKPAATTSQRLPPRASFAPLLLWRSDGPAETGVEVLVTSAGSCAEIRITCAGSAAEAVLSCAVETLRQQLPDGAQLRYCYASHGVLGCLRAAVHSLQDEVGGTARACAEYITSCEGDSAPGTTLAQERCFLQLQHVTATLQARTDEALSLLHGLLLNS